VSENKLCVQGGVQCQVCSNCRKGARLNAEKAGKQKYMNLGEGHGRGATPPLSPKRECVFQCLYNVCDVCIRNVALVLANRIEYLGIEKILVSAVQYAKLERERV